MIYLLFSGENVKKNSGSTPNKIVKAIKQKETEKKGKEIETKTQFISKTRAQAKALEKIKKNHPKYDLEKTLQIPVKRKSDQVQKKKSKIGRKIDFNQDAQKMVEDDDDDDEDEVEDEEKDEDEDENEEPMNIEDRNFIDDSQCDDDLQETDVEYVANSSEEEEEEEEEEYDGEESENEDDSIINELERLKKIEKESLQFKNQLAERKHLKLQDPDVSSSSKVLNERKKGYDVCGNNDGKKNNEKKNTPLSKATKEEMEKIMETQKLLKNVTPYEATECDLAETTKFLSSNMLAHWGVHEIGKDKNRRTTTGLKLMRLSAKTEGYLPIWETVLFPREVKSIAMFAFKNNIISINECKNKKV